MNDAINMQNNKINMCYGHSNAVITSNNLYQPNKRSGVEFITNTGNELLDVINYKTTDNMTLIVPNIVSS
jgi:hypothetical protein